jgi:hypothetical protein
MTNASVVEYQLFAANKAVAREDIERVAKAERAMDQRRPEKGATSSDWRLRWFFPQEDLTATRFSWRVDQPSIVARAMCIAGERLFVAGPPDVVDERYAYRNPDNADVLALLKRQEEAYAGKQGVLIWELDRSDGRVVARRALDTLPVFDGLAAAGGRLFLTTVDGRVKALSPSGLAALPALDKEPLQTKWDEPEDPKYLLPLPESKAADFDQVSGCKVLASKLGYRLQANGRDTVGVVLKKLDQPIEGSVVFRTAIRAVPEGVGLLRNGYLAFGNSTKEAKLVKCGVRLQPQTAAIIQGELTGVGKAVSAKVDAPEEKGLEAVVTVDLTAQEVTFVANGVTLKAKLKSPLRAITHVGYVMDSALIDVMPVKIERGP